MSDPALNLPIKSSFDPSGTNAAMAALRQLQGAQPAQVKGGGDDAARSANGYLQLQRAQAALEMQQARLARSQGDAARAAELEASAQQRLTTILEAQDATTTQTIAIQKQLVSAQQQVARASQEGAGFARQFGQELSSSFMGIVGPAAVATAAIAGISKAGELIQLGAQAGQTKARFEQLAAAAHTTGDAMLASLRQASGGTIKDSALQLDMMKASMLGVAHSAAEMGPLLAIARDRAQQMGISTEFALDSLVTGLGRGSRPILDNIGVIVKESEVNEAYARSVGKTVDQLTDQEKKQALVNEVIRQGNATIAQTGGALDTSATKIERASAALDNAKEKLGGLLALRVAPFADDLSKVANAMAGVGSAGEGIKGAGDAFVRIAQQGDVVFSSVDKVRGAISDLTGMKLPDFVTQAQGSAASWEAFVNALREGKSVAEAYNAAGEANANVLYGQAEANNQAAAATNTNTAAHATLTPTIQQVIAAASEDAAMMQQVGVQTNAAAIAAQQHTMALAVQTQQTLQASIQAQELAQFQAVLAGLGGQVAAGLLNAANAAAVLQAQYRLTAGEAERLIFLQARLANAQAAAAMGIAKYSDSVQNMITGGRSAASVQESQRQADIAVQNYRAIADAKRNQVLTVGTADQQIKQREEDLAAAERQYGKNSAQYINAETALQQERAQAARGHGRAAGAAKLSDQQRLNNQLAANEKRFESQMEDAAAAHTKKLLDIEKKYQEDSLKQQRANEISKRESELDYLKAVTESELNNTKEGREEIARINARYYADFEAAQKAAQEGNAEQSEKMTEAARKRADMELRYAEEIEKAKKAKNTSEVTRLQALREKERQVLDEQEKQIAENGDANKKARDEAIAAEDARYKDQTDHIIDQAQRAGDAKESAAQRSGKAVSAENDLLDQQLDKLRQIRDAAGQIPAPGTGGDTGGDGGESSSSENAAAGGGTFTTSGPTTLTVGDNPGGVEIVQVTPVSGTGQTRVGGSMARMAGGGALIAGGGGEMSPTSGGGGSSDELATLAHVVAFLSGILPLIKSHNKLLKEVRTYQHTMEETIRVFSQIAALHKALAQPLPALPPGIFEQLATELNAAVHAVADQVDPNIHRIRRALEHMLAAEKVAVEIYTQVLTLRQSLAAPSKPIALDMLRAFAAESVQIVSIIREQIIVANQKQTDELKRYAELVQASVGALKDVADLHKELADAVPVLDIGKVRALAAESVRLVQLLQEQVIPLAEQDAELLKRYQEVAGAAVSTLKDIADLARSLKEATPAISVTTVTRLAEEAQRVTQIVLRRMIPMAEEQAAALKRYQETQGAAVSILKDTADLGKAMTEPVAPISPAMMNRLADTANQATRIILSRAVPTTEAQADALKRYAETQGAAVEVLKNTLDLPAKLFTDYTSPSDAQITRVVADANRIARKVNDAAKAYDTKGLEAAKAFSDAVGGTFAAFKDGLLFFQALNSGDFVLDPKKLAQFETAMGRTIAMAGRLGAQAAAIGPARVAALQSTAEALTASYDSMIKLGAVPFGNLGQMTGGMGGGGNSYTFNNTFILPAGTTQQMGRQILGQLQQQLRTRR